MKQNIKNFREEVGHRLEIVRNSYGYRRSEMARRLGISKSNVYRNEIGYGFPRLSTLLKLYEEFDISLNWLLFNIEPMHTKDQQNTTAREKQIKELESKSPALNELLVAMEKDSVLLHGILFYFYKYKQDQQGELIGDPNAEC